MEGVEAAIRWLAAEKKDGVPIGLERATFLIGRTLTQPCVVCNSTITVALGIWMPDNETKKKLGAPADKMRTIFHTTCALHAEDDAAVEAAILRIYAERKTC